jgi:tetratricopeptide (TPR) repeat protein
MTAEPDVLAALDAAKALPFDMSRVTAAERVVALADDLGLMEHQLAARLLLTEAYYHVPSGPHEFPAYAWLLAALDSGVPDDAQRHQILWHAKWAMSRMIDTPDIPLDVVRRTYDDIERRYRAEGYTDNAYAQHRTRLALDTEGRAEVDHWLAVWRGAPRDEMSDCLPCESRALATVLAARGDHLAALDLIDPVLEGQASCSSEPVRSLSRAVDWYMQIGAPGPAQRAHLRGWRIARDDVSEASSVGRHLTFLVRSGNAARAMRLLLPRLGWLEELPSPGERMWFAASAAAVLHAALGEGLAPAELGGEPTTAVAERLTTLARGLAQRFDDRNGTTVVSTGVADVLAAGRYAVTVDFGALSEPTTTAPTTTAPTTAGPAMAGPAMADGTTAAPTTRAGADGPAGPAGTESPFVTLSVQELAAELRASTEAMDQERGQLLVEAWDSRRDQVAAESTEEWAAVAYLERQSAHSPSVGADVALYRARLERALEAAERADSPTQRLRTLVSLEHLDAVGGLENAEDAWARALGHVDELEGRGDLQEAAGAMMELARTPRPEDAAERATRAAELFAKVGDLPWSAYALQAAGWARSFVDPEEALAVLARARAQIEQLEASPRLLTACLSSQAQAQRRAGDVAGAAATYREAIDVVQRDGGSNPVELRIDLCDTLTDAQDWPALEAESTALVESGRTLGLEQVVAVGQRFLGLALASTGRPLEAAEALEAALPTLRSASDPSLAPALWALGNALANLGEASQASATFAEAAEAFAAQDRPNETGHAHERAGGCAWDANDLDTALEHFEAGAPLARDSGDLGLFVGLRRSRAGALATRDLEAGLDALHGVLDEARALQTEEHVDGELDEDYLGAMLERQEGLILAEHGEWARACDAASRAEQALTTLDLEAAAVARSERGRFLAAWGRDAEAEPVLRESLVELRSPHVANHRVEAAAALARTLAGQGRDDEADRIWSEFGPDAG